MSISLKELKKNRLTPVEKWVLERIRGCVSKPRPNRDNTIEWYKDGKLVFTQNFADVDLYVSYDIISVLCHEFGLKDGEILDLLTNLLYDYTDKGKLKIDYF